MTDWLTIIRADIERGTAELPVDQLEDLLGVLATCTARVERRLRTTATAPTVDTDAPVSAEVVAASLGVPVGAVREWARSGRVPCERYGRFVRFRLNAVRAAFEANSKIPDHGTPKRARKLKAPAAVATARLPQNGSTSLADDAHPRPQRCA